MASKITRISTTPSNVAGSAESDIFPAPLGTTAISPDGSEALFYTEASNLGATSNGVFDEKNLQTGQVQVVLGPLGDGGAAYSTDGRKIIFWPQTGTGAGIYERDVASGQTVTVYAGPDARVVAVSSDDTRVAYVDASDVYFVKNLTTGATVEIGSSFFVPPIFTPDLSTAVYGTFSSDQTIAENLTTGATTVLYNEAFQGSALAPNGNYYFSAGYTAVGTTISASAPDGGVFERNGTTGAVTVIAANVYDAQAGRELNYAFGGISADGSKVTYVADDETTTSSGNGISTSRQTSLVELRNLTTGALLTAAPVLNETYGHNASGDFETGQAYEHPILSPDGTKVAYEVVSGEHYAEGAETAQVDVYDTLTGKTTPIGGTVSVDGPTGVGTIVVQVLFSPDGRKVAVEERTYTGNASAYTYQDVVTDLTNGSTTTVPVDNVRGVPVGSFSSDSHAFVFSTSDPTFLQQHGPATNYTSVFTIAFPVKTKSDFDADGTSDLVIQKGGTVVDWLMKNGAYSTGNTLSAGAGAFSVVATGDFNADGAVDVALQSGSAVVDWIVKNGQYQSGNYVSTNSAGYQVKGAGDFNGDETDDLVLQNGNSVVDWTLSNGQFQSAAVLSANTGGYQVVGTGDFNGDGTTDIVLQNSAGAVVEIMRGGQYQSANVLSANTGGFNVVATGDYNGDGTGDIALQNGGTIVDWSMLGGKFVGVHAVSTTATGYSVKP